MTDLFLKVQKELQVELARLLLGKRQTGLLEEKAQDIADQFFKKRERKNRVILGESGIELVGCTLAFDIGRIMVSSWKTKFYPEDKFAIEATIAGAVPLGFAHGYQLYIAPQKGLVHTLVARAGMGGSFQVWAPAYAGMPPLDSVFFLALERAKALGHLHLLQIKH